MNKLYTFLILLHLVIFSSGYNVSGQEAIVFNGTGKSAEHRLAAMAVAGIVNRDAPRLYLQNVYQAWSYNQTDLQWRNIYEADGGAVFTEINNLKDLVEHFQDYINGVITYDPALTYGNFPGQSFRWQAETAAMLGGLSDCIPLPYTDTEIDIERSDSVWIYDHFTQQNPVKIPARLEQDIYSWSNVDLSQQQRYFELLNWALDVVLPYTNTRKFYLREITDWAISQRMFQLNLAGEETLNFYSLSDEKAEKIERVMTHLRQWHPDEVFHVYGWMRPEPLVQWISGWGGSFHETLLSNLSWHYIFPANEDFVYDRPSVANIETLELKDKHYVLFIGSEGDAGNWNLGFQSGAWHSAARGDVPLAWGFNLHMFDEFPFVAQYYYRTATANDGFISVTHPLGYAYSDMFPESFLPDAIAQSSRLLTTYDVSTIYAYKHYNGAGISTYRGVQISNNYHFGKLADFSQAAGAELTFLFDPALQTQRLYQNFEGLLYNHVNDNTFYANTTNLNDVAERIRGKLSGRSTPNFLLAGYQRFRQDGTVINNNNPADMTLPGLKTVMEILRQDPELGEKIEFVTPEQFTALIKKSILPTPTENIFPEPQIHFTANTDELGNLRLYLNTDLHGKTYFRMFDLSGRLVFSEQLHIADASNHITLSGINLPAGMYLLNLRNNKTSGTVRFIKN